MTEPANGPDQPQPAGAEPPPKGPEIEAYLRKYGAVYTTKALRSLLTSKGYDPAEIDAALAESEEERRPQLAKTNALRSRFWLLAFGIQVAVLGIAAYQLGRSTQSFANGSWIVLAIALLLGLGLSGAIGTSLVPRRGLWVGLMLPLASALLLGGTCLNMFGVLHP